jgi:hypothetical protein
MVEQTLYLITRDPHALANLLSKHTSYFLDSVRFYRAEPTPYSSRLYVPVARSRRFLFRQQAAYFNRRHGTNCVNTADSSIRGSQERGHWGVSGIEPDQ